MKLASKLLHVEHIAQLGAEFHPFVPFDRELGIDRGP